MGQAPRGQGYGVQGGRVIQAVQQQQPQPVPDRQFLAVQEAILDELIANRKVAESVRDRLGTIVVFVFIAIVLAFGGGSAMLLQ